MQKPEIFLEVDVENHKWNKKAKVVVFYFLY